MPTVGSRIHNVPEYGSNLDPDLQHWYKYLGVNCMVLVPLEGVQVVGVRPAAAAAGVVHHHRQPHGDYHPLLLLLSAKKKYKK